MSIDLNALESVAKATPGLTQAILTYERLKDADACRDQLALFKRKYGASVAVTIEVAQEVAEDFDWDWARRLLDPPALAAYTAARASARAAFNAAIAPALAAYNAATASAWAAYNAAKAPARTAFDAAIASAWANAFIESEARK